MGTILFITALTLSLIMYPIGIFYTLIKNLLEDPTTMKALRDVDKQLKYIAVSIDATGNVVCGDLFNKILRKEGGAEFGKRKETISSVLGKNQLTGTLTKAGRILAAILDFIQKDHCFRSIDSHV